MKTIGNLNEQEIDNDGNFPDLKAVDNSIKVDSADVHILFRNQKQELIKKIKSSQCIVGCVAWLTDFDILDALSTVNEIAIVVQKEDFLRPDISAGSNWKSLLRTAYGKLRNNSEKYEWPGLMGNLSVQSDPSIEPIRCVGNHNRDKSPAFPRMHNKFLVFGNSSRVFTEVWTGSFNLTKNANFSLENSVLIIMSFVKFLLYPNLLTGEVSGWSQSLELEHKYKRIG